MSRSYNKVATIGFAISNHKANSKYYKLKRKQLRRYSKNESNRIIKTALDELEQSIMNEKECTIFAYNRKERKLHRNTWDEPTDGRYIWFKPKKNKNVVHGHSWRYGYKDYQSAKELYNIYRRK